MRQFLKQTFASTIGSMVGLLLLITLGASGLVVVLFAALGDEESPGIKDKSVLVFDLSTQVRDSKPPANLAQAFSGKKQDIITLRQTLQAIARATEDDRITALFLDGRTGGSPNGYATMAELRGALEKFQAAGKKIIAYDVTLSEREYYLSSLANEIIVNPMGTMEINGLSSKQMFFKGALEKYGVGVQVIRVGDYKSAVEPYIRYDLSAANREQTKALLTDLWSKFLDTVADSRGLEVDKLQKIVDSQGYIDPEDAKNIGLIDRVGYYDNVVTELRKLTGETEKTAAAESFRQVDLGSYADSTIRPPEVAVMGEEKIAVVYAEGAIVGGRGSIETIGSDRFAEVFRELGEDETVKAIVLRVNSPGGSATASEVILREILLAKKQKPIVVSMGNVAASGGYWIAAGANQIFAEENSITGSIGVFGLLSNIQEIANDHGVTWDVVKTGKFADIGSNVRPKTEAELAIYQKSVNKTYDLFLRKVSHYRNLPEAKVKEIARGRVWSGKEAVKIGLVDEIGGLESAIAYAAQEAKLKDNWQLQEYPQQNRFETEIVQRLFDVKLLESQGQIDPLTAEFLKIRQELAILQESSDPNEIYARLPFNFEID
ncbi:signal peptide peptidase SppA [Waterburya agarophytonicola K14]|uniref:Protease 4 n=1 Tax=Waterburya agarophytonicola KI4 TaxID=2874699 RepID=A0A964FIL2_9CYAN|nr:signal peptide peptidase SppA [Waterburya agarophytonicola]MCC0179936.1 signal peptide peptidase SppA [Waterburya agarophytonicola KI4]